MNKRQKGNLGENIAELYLRLKGYKILERNFFVKGGEIDIIARKDDIYDFRGVSGVIDENHPQYGLYRFKKGFDAEFTEFIGEIYIKFKPLTYKMYKLSERLYKNLAEIKTKIKDIKEIRIFVKNMWRKY